MQAIEDRPILQDQPITMLALQL